MAKEEITRVIPPAFTGDILFHERLDVLLKKAYSYQNIGQTLPLSAIIKNILAEIYRYIPKDKATDYRKQIIALKKALIEHNFKKNRVVTSSKEEAKILNAFEEILFDLVVEAHRAKLILKDKASDDDAFNDL